MFNWILSRLREPSTYAALASFAAAAGIQGLGADTIGDIATGLIALLGIFGVVLKERAA